MTGHHAACPAGSHHLAQSTNGDGQARESHRGEAPPLSYKRSFAYDSG